jgi:thioesterase domain-containing protein
MSMLEQQALRWRPPVYPGKVLLFTAQRHIRGYSRRPGALGWDRVCPDLEIAHLPCDHQQAVSEPFVLQVASAINAVLGSRIDPA